MVQTADKGYSYEQARLKKCYQSLRLRRMICMGGFGMNLSPCGHSAERSPCDKTKKPSGPIKGRKFTDEMGSYYGFSCKAVLQELVSTTVTYRVLFEVFTNWYISSCTTKFWVTPAGNPKAQWSATLPLVKQIINTRYKRDSQRCNLHSRRGVSFPHVWASNLRSDNNVYTGTLKKNKVTAHLM